MGDGCLVANYDLWIVASFFFLIEEKLFLVLATTSHLHKMSQDKGCVIFHNISHVLLFVVWYIL